MLNLKYFIIDKIGNGKKKLQDATINCAILKALSDITFTQSVIVILQLKIKNSCYLFFLTRFTHLVNLFIFGEEGIKAYSYSLIIYYACS